MTLCPQPPTMMQFTPHGGRRVEGNFDGGFISSHGGLALLRELARKWRLMERIAACFSDLRDQRFIEHTVAELVSQRVFALCLGYEDLNDHDQLRREPLLAIAAGKEDLTGAQRRLPRDRGCPLAGKSTLNRLELSAHETDPRYKKIALDPVAMADLFPSIYIQTQPTPPTAVTLDLDSTNDPLYGMQEGRFFHGYYDEYCYTPLYIFAGHHLLVAKQREASEHHTEDTVSEVARIVARLRSAWPKLAVRVRADSGFCSEALLSWCEANQVEYVLGLRGNERLARELAPALAEATAISQRTRMTARCFAELVYQPRGERWARARRVVGKAEYLVEGEGKANCRYVVTNLPASEYPAQELYETEYCGRGDMENRIKEQQQWLFSDRTSTFSFRANQLRLWLSSLAYTLMHLLRATCLSGTSMATATCGSIRLRLLRVGVLCRLSVRRIYLSFTSSCPDADLFRAILARLNSG